MTKLATLNGLEKWQRRLTHAAPKNLQPALRSEAAAIAEEAKERAPGGIAAEIEIIDDSRGEAVRYGIGTRHSGGRHVEYGTTKQLARPWLIPALHARLPHVKKRIGKIVSTSFRGSGAKFGGSAGRERLEVVSRHPISWLTAMETLSYG